MEKDIAIAVAQKPHVEGYSDTPQHQRTPLHKTMDVVTGAYANGSTSGTTLDAKMASAIARSCGVVTLMLP